MFKQIEKYSVRKIQKLTIFKVVNDEVIEEEVISI